jgi:hypothetical protein
MARWISCFLLAWMVAGGLKAAQVQLPSGNGIWLRPSYTTVPGNETALVAGLKARAITNVFLWTIGYTSAQYVTYVPFIQQAHANGLKVHAVCATKTTVTSGGTLSSLLLSNVLNEVFTFNGNHAEAPFDGVQIDVEGVTGSSLLALVSGVSVPETLVFSAAVQPNEFYSNVESYYASLLQNTDLDVLIPMVYIMDGVWYSGGTAAFTFNFAKIQTKTAHVLSLLPSNGGMMTGLSAYDREYPVSKSSGAIDQDYLESLGYSDGFTQPAFSTSPSSAYSVPNLVAAGKPLVDVSYQTNTGVSIYRFDYDTNRWWDVIELTPIGLRRSISAADQGAAGDSQYLRTCTYIYHTTFDPYIGRQEGLTADDATYPNPNVTVQVVSLQGGVARVRVSLTNANPSEHVLGAHSAAGVHLRLEGASFVSADEGTFHAAEAFNSSGNLLANINGAQIIELRRCFFENSASPQAQSGDITISASASFTLRYRAWMMDKDSICNEVGTSEPYVARSPDDVHYSSSSRFLTYATIATNIVVPQTARYPAAVLADIPFAYYRFAEAGVATVADPFTARNLGTLGAAGNGAAVTTNYGFSTSILGAQPGALAVATNTAFGFPGSGDTNRIIVPYKPEWNVSGPFTIELWLKGGTGFSCPAASAEFDTRGWLVYQGDSGQTSGNGWYFRVYKSGSVRVTAQVNMTVSANAWYHIVGVYDGTNALLYTNGALAATTALNGTYAPNINTAYPLTFGARPNAGAYSYGGFMDEPAFYTNALSASQIAAHYAAATTNATGYAAHILAHNPPGYWRFNELLTHPLAINNGTGGAACDGAYLHWSTTVPDLQSPAWPGLETTNRVLQVFGTNGQVMIPPLNLNTNAVTFECWLKRNGSQQSFAGLVMHRNADGGGSSASGLGFHGTGNHLGYHWNDAANTYNWDSGLLPPDGQWTYAALAVSPSQAIIYMCDGTIWSAATNAISHAIQPFAGLVRVGTDGGTNRWFNGLIDEVTVYNKTLTSQQLRTHALAGFGDTNQPVFIQLPASQTVQFGTNVAFSAAVIGAPTILYRWQKDGVAIPGATNLTLGVPSADYTNAGQYRLAATNGYGGVLSPGATLVVLPPPWVTNLTYRTSMTSSGRTAELIWPAGTLYSADELTGPWTVVGGAAPPYYGVTINPAASKKFFRVQ